MFYNWLPDSTFQDGNLDNLSYQIIHCLFFRYIVWMVKQCKSGVRAGTVIEVGGEAGVWVVYFHILYYIVL